MSARRPSPVLPSERSAGLLLAIHRESAPRTRVCTAAHAGGIVGGHGADMRRLPDIALWPSLAEDDASARPEASYRSCRRTLVDAADVTGLAGPFVLCPPLGRRSCLVGQHHFVLQ